MSDGQYCTFTLGDATYGVEVGAVQEVLRYQRLTRVPLAPAVVRGLINLRGQIVTAIDLRRRLGLPEMPVDRLPMNVVLRAGDAAVSFLVDEIGDVMLLDGVPFEPPPPTLRGSARELIRGAYKLPDRLLLVLDTENVLNLPFGDRA